MKGAGRHRLCRTSRCSQGDSDPDREKLFIRNRSCKQRPFLSREMQAAALENVTDGTKMAQVLETEPGSETETDRKDGQCLETLRGNRFFRRGQVSYTGSALPTGSVFRQKGVSPTRTPDKLCAQGRLHTQSHLCNHEARLVHREIGAR